MYNKVGVHVIEGWRGSLAGSPCVTLVNPSPAYVAQVLDETRWEAKVVVRLLPEPPPLAKTEPMPRHKNVLFQRTNEQAVKTQSEAVRFLDAERIWAETLHRMGRAVAFCAPSVGQYELDVWDVMRGLKPIMASDDVVVVHEYWVDEAGLDNRWHCGRFTKVPWLAEAPIIVTEIGRDIVEGHGYRGWKAAGVSREQYLREIAQYNDEVLMPYPNVIGGTLFTVGNDPQWADYDVTDVYNDIQLWRHSTPKSPPSPEPGSRLSCEDVHAKLVSWADALDSMAVDMRHVADNLGCE